MLLDAKAGVRGRVYDLDTELRVPRVIKLVLETGYLEAYRCDAVGNILRDPADNRPLTYAARGRFDFHKAGCRCEKCSIAAQTDNRAGNGRRPGSDKSGLSSGGRVTVGAPVCARCRSPLTLPGDDLCPRCRAVDRGQRNRFVVEHLTTPLLDRPCECGCGRLATRSVGDEVGVTPEQTTTPLLLPSGVTVRKPLWDRAMTVGRHWFCDWCWKPPRILDDKGEVIEELHEQEPNHP